MPSPSRWINLTGAVNVRDLGGYKTDAGSTRWSTLFRADNLHRLTKADQQILLELGVHTVIDLRHQPELDAAPDLFADHNQIHYLHIPIFRNIAAAAGQQGKIPDIGTAYRYMVENFKAGFGEALVAIAEADSGAVLFHCTVGKDRTGILTALLLRLVGVAPEHVAADYALTTEAMQHLRPMFMEQMAKIGGEVDDALLTSNAADMTALLNYLDERYGDVYSYVQSLGLTDEQISRIQARLGSSEPIT